MSDQLSSDLASLKIDRERNPEQKGPLRYVLIVGALLGAAAVVYLTLVPYLEAKFFKAEVAVTEIALVSPAHASIELTSTGYVMPQTVSQVAAQVPGKVARVAVQQGDRVAAGDVLLELELVDQKAAIAAARSRVAAARAQTETARAQLAEARQLASRAKELFEKGVGPKAAADDAAARVGSLAAAVKAADAGSKAAQTEVDALEVTLQHYTVRAPIAGTVISKPPEIGEIVGPAMSGIAAQIGGIELADFDSLAVETDVPEARLHLVALGAPCEISLDAFPGKRYRGTVAEIVPRVNRAKATVTVKVRFADGAEGVLPDMSARVSFLKGELDAESLREPPKLVVPGAAVVDREGAKVVFVLEGDRVRMTPIQLGPPYGSGFELQSGPGAGTRVIKQPPATLVDGQRVKEKADQ